MAKFTAEENTLGTILRVRQISLQGLWLWGALYFGLAAVIVLTLGSSILKTGGMWAPVVAFLCFVAFLILDPKATYIKYDWAVQEAWKVRVDYLTKTKLVVTPETQEIREEVNRGLQPIIEILKLTNVIFLPPARAGNKA